MWCQITIIKDEEDETNDFIFAKLNNIILKENKLFFLSQIVEKVFSFSWETESWSEPKSI